MNVTKQMEENRNQKASNIILFTYKNVRIVYLNVNKSGHLALHFFFAEEFRLKIFNTTRL